MKSMRTASDTRFRAIALDGRLLPTPCFFASVSSLKTALAPVDTIGILTSVGAPLFLVSAYDFAHANEDDRQQMLREVQLARQGGAVVMLDSGGYESYWFRDNAWTAEHFYDVVGQLSADIVASFDSPRSTKSKDSITQAIVSATQLKHHVATARVMPIVHLPIDGWRRAPQIVAAVATELRCDLIAVPERELGDGLEQRIRTVKKIRAKLEQTGLAVALHLLGTGNPTSILLYSAAGADSFDGLEWCQTVVDHRTASLFHFQHYDLFKSQTRFGDGTLPYAAAALAHNLLFYRRWLDAVRQSIVTNNDAIMALCAEAMAQNVIAPVQRLIRVATR